MQKMRCYVIDFGLSNLGGSGNNADSPENPGNDLFFFCWWLVHRARQVLINMKIESLFYEVLTVHESQIPPEILCKILCRRENGLQHLLTPYHVRICYSHPSMLIHVCALYRKFPNVPMLSPLPRAFRTIG